MEKKFKDLKKGDYVYGLYNSFYMSSDSKETEFSLYLEKFIVVYIIKMSYDTHFILAYPNKLKQWTLPIPNSLVDISKSYGNTYCNKTQVYNTVKRSIEQDKNLYKKSDSTPYKEKMIRQIKQKYATLKKLEYL